MGLLSRRKPWDETLPDGSSVYEAIRRLTRDTATRPGDSVDSPVLSRDPVNTPIETTPVPPLINAPLMRHPAVMAGGVVLPPADASIAPVSDFAPPTAPVLPAVGAPPAMMLNRGGHAVSVTGGADPLEANQTLLRAQQSEVPGRESKKMIALRAGLGLLFGGIPGAASTLAGDLTDRRALDRGRIDQNIARTQGQIGQELLMRKSQNDMLNDQVERQLKTAQTIKALQPTPLAVHHDVNAAGNMVIVDSKGLATEVKDANGKPVKKLANDETLVADPTNPKIIHKYKNGQDTGQTYVVDPKYGNVPSGAAMNADATAENRDYTRKTQEETRAAQRQAALAAAAEAERAANDHQQKVSTIAGQVSTLENQLKSMGAVSPDDPDRIAIQGQIQQLRESVSYEQRQLDSASEDARKARAEALKYPEPAPQTFKPARDGKFHYTPAQIRANLNGRTYEETVNFLKSQPNVVIDQ